MRWLQIQLEGSLDSDSNQRYKAVVDRNGKGGHLDNACDKPRIVWDHTFEYLLNVIGYTIGLGNVWRFSYLCYKNGGGAFLIPYLTSALVLGFPMLLMETSVGQFTQRGCLGSWDIVPLLRGVGYSSLMISWYFLSYIMVVMAWILFYLGHSLTLGDLPWATCDNFWNSDACRPAVGILEAHVMTNMSTAESSLSNDTIANATANATKTSTSEFWNNYVLRRTEGIHDMGTFTNWRMILCFLAAWAICYLCVWRGIRTTGKAAYVTVLSPYLILVVMLIRGAMLEGAGSGVVYFIYPRLEKLVEPQAVKFCTLLEFASLCCMGLAATINFTLIATEMHTYVLALAVVPLCLWDLFSSVILVTFLMFRTKISLKLQKKVFPAGLTLLPVSQIWAVIFFIMLAFFAIDTAFGSIEGITRLLEDIRPGWFVNPGIQICRLGMCVLPFLLGLPMLFDGGIYVFELVNMYGNSGICILTLAFVEIAGLGWIYGISNYFDDVKSMIGYYPPVLLRGCMRYVDPCIIMIILVAFCVQYVPLKLGDYEYPTWANVVGWIISLTVLAPIPIVAVNSLLNGKDSFYELHEPANHCIQTSSSRLNWSGVHQNQ